MAVETGRRLGDPAVLIAGSEKIHKELRWKAHYEDLETIMKTAWRWHRNEAAKKNSRSDNRKKLTLILRADRI